MSLGVVIGAAGGIGSACARALAPSVDRVLLVGRNEERLQAVAAELGDGGVVAPADVSTAEGRDAIAGAVEASGLDLAWLVLASGVPLRGAFPSLRPEDIERTLTINFVGPVLLLRRLLDCRWKRGSSIVVIGSISASRALPNRAAYGGSKAGLEHLARTLAAEVAPLGIRVNVVAPGVIDTAFLGEGREALDEWVRQRVPAGRSGRPEEVAAVVRYVVLEAPEYLNGARIAVDGGAEVIG
jgi:3-oxoacyl-[acyl-carrier protein] reductase